MAHDANTVLLGVPMSSDKNVTEFNADPATFPAGLAVREKSDGTVSVTKADGGWLGVSLGKSLSNTTHLSVLRVGLKVPVRMALKRSTGVITITSYANLVSGTPDTVTVGATVFTAQAGAATPGAATFQAATSNEATAISLAAQINAHATANTLVTAVVTSTGVVTLYAKTQGAAAGNDVALSYVDNSSAGITLSGLSAGKLSGGSDTVTDGPASPGTAVYFNDVTGEADLANLGTISGAVYVTAGMTGLIEESTSTVGAALVDMPGGL